MPAGLQGTARPLRQATLAPAPDPAGLATIVLDSEASPDSRGCAGRWFSEKLRGISTRRAGRYSTWTAFRINAGFGFLP